MGAGFRWRESLNGRDFSMRTGRKLRRWDGLEGYSGRVSSIV